MDQNRTVTLRDELGREIERVLSIDPAPELKVRVRARIDRERASPVWWARWRLVSAGALGLIALAAMIVAWPDRETDQRVPSEQVSATPTFEAPRSAAAASQPIPPPAPRLVPEGQTASNPMVPSARTAEPEVLIPPGEAAALHLLVSGIREGRIDPTVLDDVQAVATSLEPLSEIAIQPITIEPLARLELLEGERQ